MHEPIGSSVEVTPEWLTEIGAARATLVATSAVPAAVPKIPPLVLSARPG